MDSLGRELLQAESHVWNHVFKFMIPMSLKCAVELGIPDIIHGHGRPMSLSDLASALHLQPTKAQFLGRLMRLLVHSGFFAQTPLTDQDNIKPDADDDDDDQELKYTLIPPSLLLLKQNTNNTTTTLLPYMFANLHRNLLAPWETLSTWFRSKDDQNNATAFEMEHGKTFWDLIAQEPGFRNLFHEIMVGDSNLIGRVLTKECAGVFEGLESLVDVGGGSGVMGKAIVEAFPNITCTVFDLPEVVANLKETKNLKFFGGDMFENSKIPSADAILLKWILHNWDDEKSVKILKNCREAVQNCNGGGNGKVIIIDMVVDYDKEDKEITETKLYFDLLMMMCFRGKERSEREWKNIFTEAGFSGYKIISSLGSRCLIEVYP